MKKRTSHYKLLSYPLGVDTYCYGGQKPFVVKQLKSVSKGDSCNTFILKLPNHFGTHIDCPNHFYNSGRKLCGYRIKDFIFSRPIVLDCPKLDSGIITENDIRRNRKKLKGKDILLLRTGFHRLRGSYRYGTRNPGVSPRAAEFIRRVYPNIRCIGIDSISISSYSNREIGRQVHKTFFTTRYFRSQPVFIIEDMDLSDSLDGLKKVIVLPLLVRDIDSAPCTVLGVL